MRKPVPIAPVHGRLTYEQRRELAEWLVRTFQPERYAYLALSIVSFLFLIGLGIFHLVRGGDWKSVLAMFGPAGLFTFSLMQLFQVWNKTVFVVLGSHYEPKEGE